MHSRLRRACLAAGTTLTVVTALAVAPQAHAAPTTKPSAKVTSQNVIVLLKNQHTTVRPQRGGGTHSQRAKVIQTDQAGVVTKARKLNATNIRQFSVLNAFSATLKSDKIAALRADPQVAAVVPDLPIKRPSASQDAGGTKLRQAAAGNAIPSANYCSTDQTAPRLEPEALQTMKVAYDNTATPSASKLEDGAGTTVAWLADGIDINNPDFIRANGDHVFTDYQDFSTEGVDAASSSAEAFGDASAIAAQGRQTYNLDDYTTPQNPLTAGCYVKIRGVAPGANMVGLKVFGNAPTAPTSRFIGAIQYAVTVAGVDVINESFGSNPYPDTMNDPVSMANNAAIDAGVAVVASTGDAGTNGTIGSPSSSPAVIGAAATTTFRFAAQTKLDGFSFNGASPAINGWANDNISSLSSGGYTHAGKVPDVSAPGDSGWALCTANVAIYTDCTDLNGDPVNFELFGGTSMSSPLTAGTAALVIAAYKRSHDGVRPSPSVVKSIITSTAQDLGHPAYEQGAGEVDALAAVQAALSMPAPGTTTVPTTATGTGLVTSTGTAGVNQLNLVGQPGTRPSKTFTVTNASGITQRVDLTTRQLTTQLSRQTGTVNMNGAPTFPNVSGGARSYRVIDVPVPAGASRLDASIAWNDPIGGTSPATVFMALIDPFGIYQAYNSPQGAANFSHVDARNPAPGTWHALVWVNPAFTGDVKYEFKSSKYTATGTVSPASLTLAAGHSATVTASFPAGTSPGDASAAVVMKTGLGRTADVPVSIRTLIPTSASTNTFKGVLTGGNGRSGAGSPAQTQSFYLDVPSGKSQIAVSIRMDNGVAPNTVLLGFLVGPDGYTRSAKANLELQPDGTTAFSAAVFNFTRLPKAGRWTFIVELTNPLTGDYNPTQPAVVNQPYTGSVTFAAPSITGVLPSGSTQLTRGAAKTYTVTVKNNTGETQLLSADARLNKTADYQLASQTPNNDLQNLALPESTVTPVWLVPTGTSSAGFFVNATVPVELDVNWEYGDPEVFGGAVGNASSVTIAGSSEVPNGPYLANIGEPGPFDGPAPTGSAAANAVAHTKAFDFDVLSTVGDYQLTALPSTGNAALQGGVGADTLRTHTSRAVNAMTYQRTHHALKAKTTRAAAATPECGADLGGILLPGQTCTLTVQITPSAAKGSKVTGSLNIQGVDYYGGTTIDLASLPYSYTVK